MEGIRETTQFVFALLPRFPRRKLETRTWASVDRRKNRLSGFNYR